MTVTRTVELDGIRLAALDEQQTISHIMSSLHDGKGGTVLTVNTDIMRQLDQPVGRSIVEHADLSVADGMPLVMASRLARDPLPGRVTGSSLIQTLSRALMETDGKVALIGGHVGASERAAVRLRELGQGRGRVLEHCPPVGFEHDQQEFERLKDLLEAEKPDVVFMGLGYPKQEVVAEKLRAALPTTWFIGCGGSIDMLAGDLRRAPRWVQDSGLEWLFRLLQEPRRLASRYLRHGIPFTLGLLGRTFWRRLHAPAAAIAPVVEPVVAPIVDAVTAAPRIPAPRQATP